MKEKTLKLLFLSALMFLLVVPTVSQDGKGSAYVTKEDSINCLKHLSAYRSFFKLKLYNDAIDTWWKAFNDCPASSEMMYLDGVTMYRSFIEDAPEGPAREGLIDTLMLIYDRRMEYFGGEGNVLGRKGRDLITYRGADIDQVLKAYEMLKKSIELEGKESQEAAILFFISAGIELNNAGKIQDNQVIEDYFMVIGILDQLVGRSSRWERTRATIVEIMRKEDILTCEALNRNFEPRFEQNKSDQSFLEKMINAYTTAGCDRSELYVAASESLYNINPGPESAHNLAILFISGNDFQKAAGYLKEAVLGENIDKDTRAEWFYELTIISMANKDYCGAIIYGGEAVAYRSNYGKAYIALGDAMIASRENLGEDFEQRTAFWSAADQYAKAASVDPSVAAEANQKLSEYAGQYPNHEDVFFRDLKEGETYRVEGCINENTTVRSRE